MPLGHDRYELYSEPPDNPSAEMPPPDGVAARLLHRLRARWRRTVESAERAADAGTDGSFGRMHHWLVRRIAESIDEQRTLWWLRSASSVSFVYPSDLSPAAAASIRARLLARARTHHGWWLLANGLGAAASAILILVPGPNVIGYYFVFRVAGHYLSWRGARQGLERVAWQPRPEDPAAIRVIYTRR